MVQLCATCSLIVLMVDFVPARGECLSLATRTRVQQDSRVAQREAARQGAYASGRA